MTSRRANDCKVGCDVQDKIYEPVETDEEGGVIEEEAAGTHMRR